MVWVQPGLGVGALQFVQQARRDGGTPQSRCARINGCSAEQSNTHGTSQKPDAAQVVSGECRMSLRDWKQLLYKQQLACRMSTRGSLHAPRQQPPTHAHRVLGQLLQRVLQVQHSFLRLRTHHGRVDAPGAVHRGKLLIHVQLSLQGFRFEGFEGKCAMDDRVQRVGDGIDGSAAAHKRNNLQCCLLVAFALSR